MWWDWYIISKDKMEPTFKINLTKCQKDFQRQVGDMVEKLASWREDSHKQMSTIISSHCKTFDISFNDLVEEFSELQSQVSDLKKERTVLLETINNLNGEIRQLGARRMLSEIEAQEPEYSESDLPNVKDEAPEVNDKSYSAEERIDCGGDITNSPADQDVSDLYELDHDREDHLEIDRGEAHNKSGSNLGKGYFDEKKPKCNKKEILKTQVSMHNKRNFVGENKVKCEICSFETSWKHHLKRHERTVHSVGDKMFQCGKCPFSTTRKDNFKTHVAGVHEKKRNYVCSECGSTFTHKWLLNAHCKRIHKR